MDVRSRTTLLPLVAVILAVGIAIGGIAFALYGDRGAPAPTAQPAATRTPEPTAAPPATHTVTETRTTTAKPPPLPVPVTRAPVSTTSYVPPPTYYPAMATMVGTCDEGGSCGVKQRTAPYSDAPRLVPTDLYDGNVVTAVCQTVGDPRTNGGIGTSRVWYRLANGAYVNSVYVTTLATRLPTC